MTDEGRARPIVVAIDGPSGAGKSTVARRLAERLGFRHLDTGAMYRAVTWHFLEMGLEIGLEMGLETGAELADEAAIAAALDGMRLEMPGQGRIILDGHEVTEFLRRPEVEALVSSVSAIAAVRRKMVRLQREVAARGNLVAEGRDMTSVVFSDSCFKFYVDAAIGERARRRLEEQRACGRDIDLAGVEAEIHERDRLDSTRAASPLCIVDDAERVDTTAMSIDDVVDLLAQRVREGDRA